MVVDFLDALIVIAACLVAARESVVRADSCVAADCGVEPVVEMIKGVDRFAHIYGRI